MEARPELCVGGIVVRDGKILLVRRGRPPGAGLWSVPGGRVELGEPMATAVERELREETGLSVSCGPLIGWVERIGADHHFMIMDFAAELTGESFDPTAGDDAAEAAWVDLDDVAAIELVDGLAQFLTEHRIL